MGRFFKFLFGLLVIGVLLSPVFLIFAAVDSAPLVPEQEGFAFSDVKDLKGVIKRFDPREMSPDVTTDVTATGDELSRALMAGLASTGFARGKVTVTPLGIVGAATAELPIADTPVGRFVNVSVLVLPSDHGLEIARLAIGDLEIPRSYIRPFLIYAMDQVMGEGKGEGILDSIKSVHVGGDMVQIAFQPPPTLVADLKAAAKRALPPTPDGAIAAYYEKLVAQGAHTDQPYSLALILGPVFELAEERSKSGDPVAENRAAILALAFYFGDSRFERLLSDVGSSDRPPTGGVKLEGRHDWVQHFSTSAGLVILAGSTLSDFVGVSKEILDTEGPSGFSWTDIGADRSGVRFAEVATQSVSSARNLQAVISHALSETAFFPHVRDLPEGLSEAAFRAQFVDVSAPEYQAMLKKIDDRIASVPLYK